MNKIFFLLETPLTFRDYKRFGLDSYIKNGFDCNILDFTRLFNINYLEYKNSADLMFEKTMIIKDNATLINSLNKIPKNSIIISQIYPNFKTRFLFENLDSRNLRYGFVFAGIIPFSLVSNSTLLNKITSVLVNPLKILSALKNFLLNKSPSIRFNPYFIMYAGKKVKSYYRFKPTLKTKLIKCNSYDYDSFLEEERSNKNSQIKKDYILFLDEYVPFHPDNLINNNVLNANPETYYLLLNNYFDKIERETALNVVIAAHPRSEYELIGDKYCGRKVLKNNTPNLVKFSKFVIAHSSTSISYAILYQKPLSIIYSNDYSIRFKKVISMISNELNVNPYEISNSNLDEFKSHILSLKKFKEKSSYSNYINNYMSELSTTKVKTSEIFISFLEKNEI